MDLHESSSTAIVVVQNPLLVPRTNCTDIFTTDPAPLHSAVNLLHPEPDLQRHPGQAKSPQTRTQSTFKNKNKNSAKNNRPRFIVSAFGFTSPIDPGMSHHTFLPAENHGLFTLSTVTGHCNLAPQHPSCSAVSTTRRPLTCARLPAATQLDRKA